MLDAAAGTVVWDGAPSLTPPLVVTGTSVIWPVPDEQGALTSLRSYALADGSVQWDDALPAGTRVRTASVAGSVLYLTTDDGPGLSLRTYDAATGAPLSTVALSPDDSSRDVRRHPGRGQWRRVPGGRRRPDPSDGLRRSRSGEPAT